MNTCDRVFLTLYYLISVIGIRMNNNKDKYTIILPNHLYTSQANFVFAISGGVFGT